MMSYYKTLIRPFLFSMDAEKSHEIIKKFMFIEIPFPRPSYKELETRIGDIILDNPIGLAAGFDKNAEMANFLSSLGFSYITLGSVMLKYSEGNPRPRIIRYPKFKSMTNSMGLPSLGLEGFLKNLKRSKIKSKLSISIAGNSLEEYLKLYSVLSDYADFIELNLSCPNTSNGRMFQEIENFKPLIDSLRPLKRKITFIKISPAIKGKEIENQIEISKLCIDKNIDGITAVNTLPVNDKNLATKQGGLSGKLLYKIMLENVRRIYEESKGRITINACGGIFNAEDAFKAILSGARTVQIYTALLFEGPMLVRNMIKKLAYLLRINGFKSLEEAIGYHC